MLLQPIGQSVLLQLSHSWQNGVFPTRVAYQPHKPLSRCSTIQNDMWLASLSSNSSIGGRSPASKNDFCHAESTDQTHGVTLAGSGSCISLIFSHTSFFLLLVFSPACAVNFVEFAVANTGQRSGYVPCLC